MNEQQIRTAIEARVQISKDKRYGIWTIGITDNPVRRQTERDDEGRNTRYWLSWMADSEAIARNVEAFFIEKGMKGGVGGETNGNFVYIF
jgi:hypothetical protein